VAEETWGWTEIEETASYIRDRAKLRPSVMIITGSGLGALADDVEEPVSLPYSEIPRFSPTSVLGHSGDLIMGRLEGREIAIMRGRVHFYEGYSLQRITFPIRVLHHLGADTLIVTNAAGGLNEGFEAGDLMLITDHINLVGMAGFNPLRGPNDERLGPRFPDMSSAYDVGLRKVALAVAQELGLELRQGTYVMAAGPTFETPADVHFLRLIGADAVGMSTVPEVIVARHGGMKALGVSHISNVIPSAQSAANSGPNEDEGLHQEVLDAGGRIVPKLSRLIRGIIVYMQET
jgi:purine-nucleoside phosphorylase